MTTRCVCPMGGERDCPDDCPIAVWANLSPTDRKAQRKSVATKLYQINLTMEQIATQLGVDHATISRDLKEFVHDAQTVPRQSKRGRKGEGRPKGSGSKGPRTSKRGQQTPKLDAAREIIREKIERDEPLSPHKLQDQHGISHVTFDMAITAETARKEAIEEKTALDPTLLSKSAQEKLDRAIRQHKAVLAASFNKAVADKVRQRIDEMILPEQRLLIADAKRLYDRRRGLMNKDTFNTIRRALHPDSRNSISDAKLGEAFNKFMGLEKYLLNEADSPTTLPNLPDNLAAWDKMRVKKSSKVTNPLRPAR